MMRKNRVHYPLILTHLPGQFSPQFRMIAVALGFNSLTDIVQQAAALRNFAIRSDLSCQHPGQDSNFFRVRQYILSVTCSIVQPSKGPDSVLTDVMNTEVKDNLFTLFIDNLI